MADKPIIRRNTVTTSRSWNMNGLPSGGSGHTERLVASGGTGDLAYTLSAQIENGVVTVNGIRYDSIEDVPVEDRARIEAARKPLVVDQDLIDLLEELKAEAAAEADEAFKARAPMSGGIAPAASDLAPGAVPRASLFSKLLRLFLLGTGAAAAWVTMQYFVRA